MLPSLGLFKSVRCPLYPNCNRNPCFYSHTVQRSSTIQDRPVESIKRQKTNPVVQKPTPPAVEKKRPIDIANKVISLIPEKKSSISQQPSQSAVSARAARLAAMPKVLTSQPEHTIKRTAHTPTFKTKPTGPPSIAPSMKSTVPLKTRQLIATKLFEHYARIYQPILHNQPTLATEHTKLEEKKILDSTTNLAGYKQMAMNIMMRLKKRPVSTSDMDIGLDGDWVDPALKKEEAKKLYDRAHECLVSMDTLRQLQYPLPDLFLLPVEEPPSMVNTVHKCDRCKQDYLIKDLLDKNDMDSCIYHPGRIMLMKVDGQKEKVYRCCEDALGSTGCARGPHVYKDNDLALLHQKTPFMPTPPRDKKSKTCQNLVALDCEMGYTTAGMELIRLTAVDQYMNVLLDEMVLPSNMIVDLNTQFSGVKTLEGVKYDLPGLRRELFKYIDEDTIIVGHGLENDMNALRIIHTKIIDTVALFPHKAGLPYRNSLKLLSSTILQKFIQTGTNGHDSFEDARVCIELLEAYIERQDKLK